MTLIRHLPAPVGRDALDLMGPVERALGSGPALCIDEPAGRPTADEHADAPDLAVAVRTSGSTGVPKLVLLSPAALRASADATSSRLSGPGNWLLALSVTHIAGLQVLIRSVLAGTTPTAYDMSCPFTAGRFADTVDTMPAGTRYASLVPTQLTRVLQDERSARAAATFDAILVGGAALAPATATAAADAGITVVTTYGMSETCGGCVYDGVPLDGVRTRVEPSGRLSLGGPVVADGYLGGGPDLADDGPGKFGPGKFGTDDGTGGFSTGDGTGGFSTGDDGTRWFTTSDLGSVTGGVLTLTGRADDVIVSGGTNVPPAAVEAALTALPGIGEALVVGIPDDVWGSAVTALIVPDGRPDDVPTLDAIRSALKPVVGAAATPRGVLVVEALPVRGLGKPDRHAARELLIGAERPHA